MVIYESSMKVEKTIYILPNTSFLLSCQVQSYAL